MINILSLYNNYYDNIENYKNLKINENDDNRMKGNISLLMNEIANKLNDVSEYYFIKIEEVKNEINTKIEKNLNFKDNFIEKLDAENRINNTQKAYNNLNLIKEYVLQFTLNLFNNFTNEIDNITENQRNEKKKELDNAFRRLTEYDIYYINGKLKPLQESYENFTYQINTIQEYIDLSSAYNNFFSKIMDEVNEISSYINSTYIYLKYIYPDLSKLDNYFSNIENITEDMKILTLQYLRNETYLIDKTKVLIKNNLTQIYPHMSITFNNQINNFLNKKIPLILRKLEKINEINSSKFNDINLTSKYENVNYLFSKLDGKIKDINYFSSFSFDYDLNKNLIIFN
jgi:hypothetical protein